jgi:hypothetical protein
MRTIETKVWCIDEHPNKNAVYEWMRDNMYDLNDHALEEVINSLNALQKIIGGKLDYSISVIPCRGEYITFTDYDKESLMELNAGELPLTGVYLDAHLIESMQRYGNADGLLDALHRDTEYVYSDDGIHEICTANDYEFTEDGKLF